MSQFEFHGVRVDLMTVAEVKTAVAQAVKAGDCIQHGLVNVAKFISMQQDKALRDAVNNCDITNVDGVGLMWGMRAAGVPVPERVNGTDLFEDLLGWSEQTGVSVFLLGAREPVVEQVVEVVSRRHPELRIAGYHHGYFWDDEASVVQKIQASGAQLLFVAITSPRKELFIDAWRDTLGVSFVMGVGGSFDVVAGKVSRAPGWMQRWGLEWFYRVLQEPRRMWRRYLVTNLKFALMLAVDLCRRVFQTAKQT